MTTFAGLVIANVKSVQTVQKGIIWQKLELDNLCICKILTI